MLQNCPRAAAIRFSIDPKYNLQTIFFEVTRHTEIVVEFVRSSCPHNTVRSSLYHIARFIQTQALSLLGCSQSANVAGEFQDNLAAVQI